MPRPTTAPLDQLVEHPDNPLPPGARCGRVLSSDGVSIRYARFQPVTGRPRGTVLLLPGRAEFIEKYFEVVRDLAARGFAAVVFDWRGQGGSQRLLRNPMKGHVETFSDYARDLRAVYAEVVLPDCPPPYTVLAHSMGGTVALLEADTLRSQVSRLVLSAPLLGLKNRDRGRLERTSSVLSYLGLSEAFVPGGKAGPVQFLPFEGNLVTSDPVRYGRTRALVEAEPLLGLGAATIGWVNAAMRALALLAGEGVAAHVRIPTLIIQAGDERLVSNRDIETFVRRLRLAAHVAVPGARHELMMERDGFRDQFFAAFDSFLEADARAA